MRKRRFSEEQIIGVLKQADGGMNVQEVCRQNGIPRHTLYVWRGKPMTSRRKPRPSFFWSASSDVTESRGEAQAYKTSISMP